MKQLLIVVLFGGLTACITQTAGTDVPAVETISKSTQCSFYKKEGKAIWLDNEESLTAEWEKISAQGLALSKTKAPEVDFTREGIVAVFMGQRASAGYHLTMEPQTPIVAEGIASLNLHYISPPEGAMSAQVMTSPCLLLKLEKGAFRKIRIVDQTEHEHHLIKML